MRAWRLAVGLTALTLGLAVAAPAQELSLSLGAGGFFPSDDNYRLIYGSSLSFVGDIEIKLRGPLGFSVGFGRMSDKGVAVPMDGGTATYPVEFRRTSVPLIVFYQFDVGPVAICLGTGAGIHSYREAWQTADLDFEGHKVSPRYVLKISAELFKKISLFCSGTYESIRTGAGADLARNIDLGGFQLLGGLAFRIF
jgi:hypothetical protein